MRRLSDRKHIWFDGPAGSGKTSLIERAISSNRTKSLGAARFLKNAKARQPVVRKKGNEETDRYGAAGAQDVALIEYADKHASTLGDFFWQTQLGATPLDAVYCEGPAPSDLFEFPVDFILYIMRPLLDPAGLFEKQELKPTSEQVRAMLMNGAGSQIAAISDKFSKMVDETMSVVMQQQNQKLEGLAPIVIHKLLPDYVGLAPATTIIVTIEGEHERTAATALLNFIAAVHLGTAGINHGLSYKWKEKKSTFILNLNDPKDPELKRAVNMIKRRS